MFFVRFVNRPVGPVFLLAMDLLPKFVWKTNKKLWVTSDETAIFFPYQDFWLCTQLLVRSSLSTAVGVS